jgi:hypothetical protein
VEPGFCGIDADGVVSCGNPEPPQTIVGQRAAALAAADALLVAVGIGADRDVVDQEDGSLVEYEHLAVLELVDALGGGPICGEQTQDRQGRGSQGCGGAGRGLHQAASS